MVHLSGEQRCQEKEYVFPYHYLDLGSDYHKFLVKIEDLDLLVLVKDTLSPFDGQRILDVGCGDGRLCYELRKEKCDFVGVDFSAKAVGFARVFNPGADFFVQDIEQIDVREKFDVIVLMEVLEHIIPSSIPTVLSHLSRVLKLDGKLIITVPSNNRPLCKKHYQHFTAESLAETLKPQFKIQDIKGYGKTGWQRMIFRVLRVMGKVLYAFEKNGLVRQLLPLVNRYYQKHLSLGKPAECRGIIAVCTKV